MFLIGFRCKYVVRYKVEIVKVRLSDCIKLFCFKCKDCKYGIMGIIIIFVVIVKVLFK